METYGQRLELLLDIDSPEKRRAAAHELADFLGITYQAVMKIFKGDGAFTASNNSLTAKKYDVSSDWLATGEGERQRPAQWPYSLFSPGDYYLLSQRVRDEAENALAGAILRVKQANAQETQPQANFEGGQKYG